MEEDEPDQQPELSPKPMTPRRVKRRSVMARGTSSHNVTGESSNRSSRRHSNGRSSTRSSRRKIHHQNPVTKLIEQQQQQQQQANYGAGSSSGNRYPHMTPSLTASNLKSLNQSADPIYYNMNSSSPLLTSHSTMALHQQQQVHQQISPYQAVPAPVGHYNPTYQHSTPNLVSNSETVDELYHRPPSVRSSYSNFHGARSVYALNNLATNGGDQHPPIPQRRPTATNVAGRTDPMSNDRSMSFMSNAPPAYNYLNYHTPPDSETTM